MAAQSFDHERLDVLRLSIDYVARSFEASQSLEGLHRHARDQWLHVAQSIPLNIVEGNGKRSLIDRARFLDIAHGSALDCAATSVLVTPADLRCRGARRISVLATIYTTSGDEVRLQSIAPITQWTNVAITGNLHSICAVDTLNIRKRSRTCGQHSDRAWKQINATQPESLPACGLSRRRGGLIEALAGYQR